MGAEYPCLRYPGNITGEEQAQPGRMLGWDEVGRPYEVIDTEFIEGDDRSGDDGYTNVYLQYAKPETIRAAVDAAREARTH